MLKKTDRRRSEVSVEDDEDWESEFERRGGSGKGKGKVRDTSGRMMPVSERAPAPGTD